MRSRRKPILLYAASLMLGGALLGVQFGRAAVGEIDPGFYRMFDEYHSFARYSAAHDGQYPGEQAGLGIEAAGCTDCALGTGRHPWLEHPVFSDADLGITQAVAAEVEDYGADEPVILPPEVEAPPPPRNFERYAYYQVDANDPPVEEKRQAVAAVDQTAAACAPGECTPVGM